MMKAAKTDLCAMRVSLTVRLPRRGCGKSAQGKRVRERRPGTTESKVVRPERAQVGLQTNASLYVRPCRARRFFIREPRASLADSLCPGLVYFGAFGALTDAVHRSRPIVKLTLDSPSKTKVSPASRMPAFSRRCRRGFIPTDR